MEDLSQDDFDQGETDRDPDEGGEEEQEQDGGARQHQRLFEKLSKSVKRVRCYLESSQEQREKERASERCWETNISVLLNIFIAFT